MAIKREKCTKTGCNDKMFKTNNICRKHYVEKNKNSNKTDGDGILVRFCSKCADFRKESGFRTKDNKISTRCGRCLETTRRAEEKRFNRDRNEQYREYEARPERQEKKRVWREENYEKTVLYWLDARGRKIEEDEEAYLRKNAENAKEWRGRNPDKMLEQYENAKLDPKRQLYYYKYTAEKKGIKWLLTDEQAYEMFEKPCTYCDTDQNDKLTGIDRVDNSGDYTPTNTVASCAMCNYMKNSMDIYTFIKRCVHISTHKKNFPGKFFPEAFPDIKGSSYSAYKNRAVKKKNIEFYLSKKEYDSLIVRPCYLCGKRTHDQFWNGIDRVDNDKGYYTHNVQPCCNSCNVLKREYPLNDFIMKCWQIADHGYEALMSFIEEDNDEYEPMYQCKQTVRQKSNRDRTKELANRNKVSRQKLQNPEHRKNHAKKLANKQKQSIQTKTM